MFDVAEVRAAAEVLREQVRVFEPGIFSGADALELVQVFESVERSGATGKALSARRVDETRAYTASGFRDTASYMASTTGTSRSDAQTALDTAKRLADQPGIDKAVRAGDLSGDQAALISKAVQADPSSEKRLLERATSETLPDLKQDCRQVVLSVEDRQADVHRRRYFRSWTDDEGGFSFRGYLTADRGAELLAAMKPHRDAVFASARKENRREGSDAYEADAFMALIASKGTASTSPKAKVNVFVDHAALVRGNTQGGERCDIEGVGPVSVATANRLLGDSILRVLVRSGVDIVTVTSPTRVVPQSVRTALHARDRKCVVPGCDATKNLEIDHRLGFVITNDTSLPNLNLLCSWHHDAKTYRGFTLEGKPGAWKWKPPPEPPPPMRRSG